MVSGAGGTQGSTTTISQDGGLSYLFSLEHGLNDLLSKSRVWKGGRKQGNSPRGKLCSSRGSSVVTKAPPRGYVDGVTARYCAQAGRSGSSMDSPLNFAVRLKLSKK